MDQNIDVVSLKGMAAQIVGGLQIKVNSIEEACRYIDTMAAFLISPLPEQDKPALSVVKGDLVVPGPKGGKSA